MIPEFAPLGDCGVRVSFAEGPGPRVTSAIVRFCCALAADPPPGVSEWVPAYTTVAVYYRPWQIGYDALCLALTRRARRLRRSLDAEDGGPRLVEIPVCYDGMFGPDLDDVAALHGLTPAEVIRRHCAPRYRVQFLGFLPGFAYLTGLPPGLATPRLDTPRQSVPAGAVGIGGSQTGVYPLESPGGWRIIGRTPRLLFDPSREPPALLRADDRVRFVPITAAEFEAMAGPRG